jgi:hypothetical protein
MISLTQFIEDKSTQLLTLLKQRNSSGLKLTDSMSFVEDVLHEFYIEFSDKELPVPQPRERVFWSTVYQLEEATEVLMDLASRPEKNPGFCAYVKMIEVNLVKLEHALRYDHPQSEFFSTRPGEMEAGSHLSSPF